MVDEITSQDFHSEVLDSELPVFACFTAAWCGSCFPACMAAGGLAEEYQGKIKFVRINVEEAADVAKTYGIKVVPTITLFHRSEIVRKLAGYQEKPSLRRMLDAHLEFSGP